MTASQYNNTVQWTLANTQFEQDVDSLTIARAVFKNTGSSFPNGNCEEALQVLRGDFMGWRACSYHKAQECANYGIAAFGLNAERIFLLISEDDKIKVKNVIDMPGKYRTMVATIGEIPEDQRLGLQFFAYAVVEAEGEE